MTDLQKLYLDLAKGVTLGAFAAVVFREGGLGEKLFFAVIGGAALAIAHNLARKGD